MAREFLGLDHWRHFPSFSDIEEEAFFVVRLLALCRVLHFPSPWAEPLGIIAPVPTKMYAFLQIWHPCLPEPGIELMTTENTQI